MSSFSLITLLCSSLLAISFCMDLCLESKTLTPNFLFSKTKLDISLGITNFCSLARRASSAVTMINGTPTSIASKVLVRNITEIIPLKDLSVEEKNGTEYVKP